MKLRIICCLAVLLCACRSVTPVPDSECEQLPPEGQPGAFTLAAQTLNGVTVAPAQECPEGHYIELEGPGERQLVLRRELTGADLACANSPAAVECPKIQVDSFANAAIARLADQDIPSGGFGLGPCGKANQGYDEWNFSIAITDWTKADDAVRIVAHEMVEWNVGNSIGVAVRPRICAVPLEE
jgi:hypothetical protein